MSFTLVRGFEIIRSLIVNDMLLFEKGLVAISCDLRVFDPREREFRSRVPNLSALGL